MARSEFHSRKELSRRDYRTVWIAVCAACCSGPAAAAEFGSRFRDGLSAFGRLHPLFIHAPIALLLVALVCGIVRRTRGRVDPSPTAAISLRVGAAGAVLAAVSGYFKAEGAGYRGASAEILSVHRILGIAVAALAVSAWICDAAAVRSERAGKSASKPRAIRFLLLAAAAATAGGAGSFGGTLTHGAGYWSEPFLAAERSRVAAATAPAVQPGGAAPDAGSDAGLPAIAAGFDYTADVRSTFSAYCVDCHGPTKRKGDLRLDEPRHLFADGLAPASVRPGDPAGSDLLRRLHLPQTVSGAMPPDGARLDGDAIAGLAAWIAAGCVSGPPPVLAAGKPRTSALPEPAFDGPKGPLKPLELDAVVLLRGRGGLVAPVAGERDGFEVNLSFLAGGVDAAVLGALRTLGPRVVDLNLSGTAAADDAVDAVLACTELRRLSLQGTAVRDAGVARLAELPRLVSLNLHETRVTDAAVDALAKSPSLRRVYLWRTEASPEAMARLSAVRSDLRVEGGTELLEPVAATK